MICASRLGHTRPVQVVVARKSTSSRRQPARSMARATAALPTSTAPRRQRSLSWSTLSSGVNVSGSM